MGAATSAGSARLHDVIATETLTRTCRPPSRYPRPRSERRRGSSARCRESSSRFFVSGTTAWRPSAWPSAPGRNLDTILLVGGSTAFIIGTMGTGAILLGGLGSAELIAYGGVLTAIGTYGGVVATAGSVLSECRNGVSGRCIGSATVGAISMRLGGSGSPAVTLISSGGSLVFDWILFATGGE